MALLIPFPIPFSDQLLLFSSFQFNPTPNLSLLYFINSEFCKCFSEIDKSSIAMQWSGVESVSLAE